MHIGGSHIQADIYSDKVRKYLRRLTASETAPRGLIFPFTLAGTNNPSNYSIQGDKSRWKGLRSSVRSDSTLWGLMGISAWLTAPADTLRIEANAGNGNGSTYRFNGLRILTDSKPEHYHLSVLDSGIQVTGQITDTLSGFHEILLSHEVTGLSLGITLDTSLPAAGFRIMGIDLRNDNPGLSYISLGVNGASFDSFERCAWFDKQLGAYPPDLFIISIGTNDAHANGFDSALFAQRYERMVDQVLAVNPGCALLLTVPNDSYYKRRHPLRNTRIQQAAIHQLARRRSLVVWDFYAVMGGLGSSQRWYHKKLMKYDRVHFTSLGYSIKGDLFTAAFLEAWDRLAGREVDTSIKKLK
jgi:lysophospholipase L1-like esterase